MSSLENQNAILWHFEEAKEITSLASGLIFSITEKPHRLSLLAATALQGHLIQKNWEHNFGLPANADGVVIGKMFGVLVVRTSHGNFGYLAAFSGKLAGKNHHEGFVPPVYDALAPGSFLNTGMKKLAEINLEISALELEGSNQNQPKVSMLKNMRKSQSRTLQNQLFEQYHFLNKAGQSKSLIEVFKNVFATKPPAGAGECAAPKLLQYAFMNDMEPLALAEFWWGLSPKSAQWKHGHFYPPCHEKCAPILAHMLS